MLQRVILPLDGSEVAEQALPHAVELAERLSVPLTLVRAYQGTAQTARTLAVMHSGAAAASDPETMRTLAGAIASEEGQARAYLDIKADELRQRGLTVDVIIKDRSPADAILNEAHRGPGGLVVMSTHGRGGLSRLLLGSTAQDVLKRAEVPVLVVRATEDADEPAR